MQTLSFFPAFDFAYSAKYLTSIARSQFFTQSFDTESHEYNLLIPHWNCNYTKDVPIIAIPLTLMFPVFCIIELYRNPVSFFYMSISASGISCSSINNVWIIPSLLFPELIALIWALYLSWSLKCVSVPPSTNSPYKTIREFNVNFYVHIITNIKPRTDEQFFLELTC